MRKILLTALCAALLASCALFNQQAAADDAAARAAIVSSVIAEAKSLQALAKARGLETPGSVNSLIEQAEMKNSTNNIEAAFLLADEAILQLHIFLLKQENASLVTENKSMAENLEHSEKTLEIYRSVLKARRNVPKEQVIL